VWPSADGSTFLHSGKPLPEGNGIAHRGEINSVASEAWRQGGDIWNATVMLDWVKIATLKEDLLI